MALYYYLISSLPDISATGELPISYDEFLEMCEGNVSAEDYEILKNLTLDSTEGPLISEWAQFYGNLTKELNIQRSAALGKTYQTDIDKDAMSTLIAQAALSAKNPLEAERVLLEHEFEALEHYVGIHYFDKVYLFGYAIKLKLLERQSCFVKSKGEAEFKNLFETVQKSVYNL